MHNSRRYEKEVFRFVENELYAYPWLEQEMVTLRSDIIGASADRALGMAVNEGWSDPTLSKTIRLVNSKRLKRLTENYEAISRILSGLNCDERQFIELKYWKRELTDYGISQRLHISRRTVYNWRQKILRMIADELGLL